MIMMTINKNSIDFCTYVPDEMKIIEDVAMDIRREV